MESKKIVFLILLSAAFGTFAPLHGSGGANSGEILVQSLSAKAQGFGETYASLGADIGDVTAFQYNPASLGFLNNKEMSVTYKGGILGDNLGILCYGTPINFRQSRKLGSAAGTFLYYTVGNTKFSDSNGIPRDINVEKDYGFIFSYSALLGNNLSLGANGKILHSKLLEKFSATAFAFDLGSQYRIGAVSVGASLQNIGNGLKYDKRTEELPFTIRAGASYLMQWFELHKTLFATDLIKERNERLKSNFALQYTFDDLKVPLAFRFGYRAGQDAGRVNYGLGIGFGPYKLDYSMQVLGESGNSHFVTLGYTFGVTPYTPQARSFEEGPTSFSDTSPQIESPKNSVQPATPVLKKRFH